MEIARDVKEVTKSPGINRGQPVGAANQLEEYGVSFELSTYGDIFNFGILVLEMLTGKSPTDEMFEDGQNLHNFVTVSFPDNLLQILDPLLVPTEEAAPLTGNN
ncbi:hypothetical protein LR48_Vigan04g061600 [Vigna angularis]|uniref:Serine-threonine/tyrosine-protein kinase catalytic domain-containing protein n=1 Tax=Phaseolus angularis TaxID=3914 RepID=A0A0L9UCD0_PHAAN|nr:hypothetical protein LR48_Vigan04g061600 [Vigna angularis]